MASSGRRRCRHSIIRFDGDVWRANLFRWLLIGPSQLANAPEELPGLTIDGFVLLGGEGEEAVDRAANVVRLMGTHGSL